MRTNNPKVGPVIEQLRETMPSEAQVALDMVIEQGARLFWVSRLTGWLWVGPRDGCACKRRCSKCVAGWKALLPETSGWWHRGGARFKWSTIYVGDRQPEPRKRRARRRR